MTETKKIKLKLHLLQEGRCFYCGERLPIENATLDHIVPLSLGGETKRDNLALCCKEFNQFLGDLNVQDKMKLSLRLSRMGEGCLYDVAKNIGEKPKNRFYQLVKDRIFLLDVPPKTEKALLNYIRKTAGVQSSALVQNIVERLIEEEVIKIEENGKIIYLTLPMTKKWVAEE